MIDWRYVLVKVSHTPGRRPRSRLAQLIARSQRGMRPWEVEVLFFSRVVKRVSAPVRVKVSDLIAGWSWRSTPAELRSVRKTLARTI